MSLSPHPNFHESVEPRLKLNRVLSPGEANRVLKSLGFKLHYDCYDFPRPDPKPHPNWQSDALVSLAMYRNGEEVDAQEECDELGFQYLLASLDAALVDPFLELVVTTQSAFGGVVEFSGKESSIDDIRRYIDSCITELMTEWGEEPGSKTLDILIASSYPR